MKHLIFILSVAILLASCSKNTQDLTVEPPVGSKLEFKLDGSLKQYFQVNAGVVHVTASNVYTFTATKNPTGDNYFQLSFKTDSLRTGTYSIGNGVVAFREGNLLASNVSTTDFTITITSNVNGLVNGTFKGTLYNQTESHNSSVVEGLIQNIQLNY